jgi:hypothetical protein
MPSFVGYPIDTVSFYKNRIVFASRQNVICSQAGDYFNFFASTVITIVDSDPIDLSASTLKPIRLKHAIAAPQGLLLFGDNAQLLLSTTTEAFSPKTAEVNLLSQPLVKRIVLLLWILVAAICFLKKEKRLLLFMKWF